MADGQYAANPLRPYYIPPSIGRETQAFPSSNINLNATTSRASASSTSAFSFPDLDYSEYIPEASTSVTGQAKSLIDKAVWKYASVVMAQPFEVAKLILQARVAQEGDTDDAFHDHTGSGAGAAAHTRHDYGHDDNEEDDDDDEPNYFASATPFSPSASQSPGRGRRGRPSRSQDTARSFQRQQHQPLSPESITIKNPHSLLDALSALSSHSGALSVWRGTNSTFIYSVLLRTFETFFRSFLAAVFGIAESELALSAVSSTTSFAANTTILASTSPAATVLIATAATGISALLLAPIDAARTRLILTPATQEPRSLLSTVRTLTPSYLIPTHLVPITFLTSTIPTLLATSTPLLLKQNLGLDPSINPTTWSILTFVASAFDLSIKFPLETILRRAQIATWTSPTFAPPTKSQSQRKAIKTIVPVPQTYRGVLPTLWAIIREEGYSESAADRTAALMGKAPRRKRKGQGVPGLYRGWRVGLWGLVGVWGTSFVGGLQGQSEGVEGVQRKF